MHVTKWSLGEGYIVATGVVLASVLFGSPFQRNPDAVLWSIAWGGPVLFLAGAAFWLKRLNLTSDQVWIIAQFSALGLGVGKLILVLVEVVSPIPLVTTIESILLISTLPTMAVAGTITVLALTFYRAAQETRRRNAVLNRVLRHNLRNDMTVVLCALDDIEAKSNGECTESIHQARNKITSLVSVADKLRQSNGGRLEQDSSQQVRDLSSLVTERVEQLRDTFPNLSI